MRVWIIISLWGVMSSVSCDPFHSLAKLLFFSVAYVVVGMITDSNLLSDPDNNY